MFRAERLGERFRRILIDVGNGNQLTAIALLKRLRVCLGDSARSDECKFEFVHKDLLTQRRKDAKTQRIKLKKILAPLRLRVFALNYLILVASTASRIESARNSMCSSVYFSLIGRTRTSCKP